MCYFENHDKQHEMLLQGATNQTRPYISKIWFRRRNKIIFLLYVINIHCTNFILSVFRTCSIICLIKASYGHNLLYPQPHSQYLYSFSSLLIWSLFLFATRLRFVIKRWEKPTYSCIFATVVVFVKKEGENRSHYAIICRFYWW